MAQSNSATQINGTTIKPMPVTARIKYTNGTSSFVNSPIKNMVAGRRFRSSTQAWTGRGNAAAINR